VSGDQWQETGESEKWSKNKQRGDDASTGLDRLCDLLSGMRSDRTFHGFPSLSERSAGTRSEVTRVTEVEGAWYKAAEVKGNGFTESYTQRAKNNQRLGPVFCGNWRQCENSRSNVATIDERPAVCCSFVNE
jgi:hypothetical protein